MLGLAIGGLLIVFVHDWKHFVQAVVDDAWYFGILDKGDFVDVFDLIAFNEQVFV